MGREIDSDQADGGRNRAAMIQTDGSRSAALQCRPLNQAPRGRPSGGCTGQWLVGRCRRLFRKCPADLSPILSLPNANQPKIIHFQHVARQVRGSPSAPVIADPIPSSRSRSRGIRKIRRPRCASKCEAALAIRLAKTRKIGSARRPRRHTRGSRVREEAHT
jgi:hypothetical protein